jgi:GntR family transcriptional regulator
MLDERSPLSLYYQIKEILIKKIKDNEWPVNTKMPTERELCEMFGVSRITVRQALDEMKNEGYLYRKQGKGTFVTTPKLETRLNNFYSFSEEIKKMGSKPGTEIISFDVVECCDTLSQYLELEKGAKAYAIKRLRLAFDEPFALEISYIPYDMVMGMTKEEVEKNGLYNTLKNTFGITPNEATETFEAILTPSDVCPYLKVRKNSAALKLERITRAQGKIVEYCLCLIRGDKYKCKVLLK